LFDAAVCAAVGSEYDDPAARDMAALAAAVKAPSSNWLFKTGLRTPVGTSYAKLYFNITAACGRLLAKKRNRQDGQTIPGTRT